MRTVFLYIAIITSILSIPFTSQAEEKHGRFFAGAGVSYVREDFDDGDLRRVPGNSNIDNSKGINVFGGYWWLEHLAVEGNFNWYADFEGEVGDIDFDISIWTVMLDLKVISPALWEDRIFPYLRIQTLHRILPSKAILPLQHDRTFLSLLQKLSCTA